MIDYRRNQDREYASVEIWRRLNEVERNIVLEKFPNATDIRDSRVKNYLVDTYKDRLIEVVVK